MRLDNYTMEDVGMFLGIMFGIFIISMVFLLIATKAAANKNNKYPVRESKVKLISKECANGLIPEHVIFETDDGERINLVAETGNSLVVGDIGMLTWQGTKIISFSRDKKI